MRVTLVSRIFLPEPAAASERLGSLTRELLAEGHGVEVLTTQPPRGLRGAAQRLGERRGIRRWPVLRNAHGYVRGYLQYASFDIPAFFRVLASRRPDIVVVEPPPTTGFAVMLACALRRLPFAYYAADVWSLAAKSTGASAPVVHLVRWLESTALSRSAVCVAVTEEVAQRVRRLAPRSRVVVVGHGVDESTFHAGVQPCKEPSQAVYVGTASEWHGASVFIEALAIARQRGAEITADFIGQGSEWSALQARVREHGLEDLVRFRPPVSGAQAASMIRSARVALGCLQEGVGYDFAVPTKVYSALAVGTPVIYAGPDPVRSMIDDNGLGAGCPRDPAAVADALVSLTRSESTASSRARRARWAAENVSGRAVAQRVIGALREAAVEPLVGPRRPRR